MDTYTYNFEISTLVAQFLDTLNGMTIKRWDRSTSHSNPVQKGSDILPTILYSPKQRVIHDYINNQAQHRLPVISVSIGGISRDETRVFNKLEGPDFTFAEGNGRAGIKQPIPIDLQMNVSIMSKYQEDMDQVITNFAPYADDYIVASWPSPYLPNQEIRTTIIWSGDINLEYPTDTTYNDYYRITGDTSFTVKGWLFKAESPAPQGFIHNIYTYFHAVSDIYCSYDANVANEGVTDTEIISGRPTITNAMPLDYIVCSNDTISIGGTMFDFTSAFFISGADLQPAEFFDFSNTSVSANVGSFSGIRVYPTVLSPTIATFSIPSITATSNIDVIGVNEAGVGRLTVDSVRTVTYPAPSAAPGEEGWIIYQPPSINGIKILNIQGYCD